MICFSKKRILFLLLILLLSAVFHPYSVLAAEAEVEAEAELGELAETAPEETGGTPVKPVYIGPSFNATVVGTVARNEAVTILWGSDESWSRVQLSDGTVGSFPSADLLITGDAESGAEPRMRTASSVALRTQADQAGGIAAVLPAHLTVEVIGSKGAYLYVLTPAGKYGYISKNDLKEAKSVSAVVHIRPVLSATGAVTEDEARERMQELANYFLDGYYWNHYGSRSASNEEMLYSLTSIPCTHRQNGYFYCNQYCDGPETLSFTYGTLTQCMGYASLISDLTFGTDAPLTMHRDLNNIKIGDHLRLRDYEHSMIVSDIETGEDGAQIFHITEVNADYENCEIDWERTITVNWLRCLRDDVRVYTRYAEE